MTNIDRGIIVSRWITGSDQERAIIEQAHPEIITESVRASGARFRA